MTTLSTEEFATYVARTGALGVTLRELQQKVTYKGWVEHIGLIPRGLVWREHFPYTKKKMAGLLLATAEIERALGRDGADLISRIENHDLFYDPKFRSPITMSPDGKGERFDVSFDVFIADSK